MIGKLNGSLQMRMTALFGLIVLIGCAVLGVLSYNQAKSALEDEAVTALQKLAKQAAETVETRLQARLYVVEALANTSVIRGKSGDREATLEEKLQTLSDELKRAESFGFKRLGLADKNGEIIYHDGSKANIADRDYFKAALGGKSFISSTIVSKIDGSVVFIFSSPVRHHATNEITGVLTGTVDGTRLGQLVASITYGRTGYAFVVDGTGKMIAHKDNELVKSQENYIEKSKTDPSFSSIGAVIAKMAKGEEGVASYTYQGLDMVIGYAPIKSTGWSVGVNVPRAEVLERVAGLKQSALLVSLVIIFAALALTFVIARTITIPITQAVGHLSLIASGDFTQSVSEHFLHRRDEVGKLVQAIGQLQASLKPLLAGLKGEAKTLAGNSETLSAASEEIASSSNEVARAIQQVAAGAAEQAGHLQEILGLIGNITSSLEKVYIELGRVKDNSVETSRLADVGKKELDILVASIKEVREAFQVVAEKLIGLRGSVNQVGEILEVINGIADQTNLLALNAAIEAARAGEAGRGFAVVADEVRKLAEQSRASSDKIRTLLGTIAADTNEVVATSEEVKRQVVAQLENVENTVKSFDDILESVAAIAPMLEATYGEMDSTVKNKDIVLDRVQNVSAVSEETSASAQEISASAEELSATTEEIAANAQEILMVAKKLEEQTERFKV
ncbi:MAG: methyl-accepting chemotaxis protein [Firmicutes bacterium]|nr:methyl-accepting chemotaxis protein [Bacillota bacterium]